jgi:hypothetical protein
MSDFAYFQVSVSRTSLGLPTLDLNDRLAYITADQIFGAQQAWNRQTAKSPYVDGEFLVNASRGLVQDRFSVQVLGSSQSQLQSRIKDLTDAFGQPSYVLTVTMEDGVYPYSCQPADYQVDWTAARWMARQVLVTFTVPRQPVAGA